MGLVKISAGCCLRFLRIEGDTAVRGFAARRRFLPLCGICFGTHIDKCRKFTLFRYAFHKAQCAKAKSAVFAFAREYRNRARSPLFGKVASMRQIECAYRKASFSDAQFDYGKRGLFFCVTLPESRSRRSPVILSGAA